MLGRTLPRIRFAWLALGTEAIDPGRAILRPESEDGWKPRVVTSSGHTGAGLDEIWEIIGEHHEQLTASGELDRRRRRQLLGWMWSLVDDGLRAAVREHPQVAASLEALEEDVLEGRTTPTAAADQILDEFGVNSPNKS